MSLSSFIALCMNMCTAEVILFNRPAVTCIEFLYYVSFVLSKIVTVLEAHSLWVELSIVLSWRARNC